jgi:Xaa-Pro aminopeptidase
VAAADQPNDLQRRTQVGVEAALRSAGPGIRAAEIFAQATQPVGKIAPHPVLGDSVGRRIGFSPTEGSELRRDATHVLNAGDVYALHVGASDPQTCGAVASAMVAITRSGCEVLARSPEISP